MVSRRRKEVLFKVKETAQGRHKKTKKLAIHCSCSLISICKMHFYDYSLSLCVFIVMEGILNTWKY